jgi:hypothetical protein
MMDFGTNMKKITSLSFLALGLYVGLTVYKTLQVYKKLDLNDLSDA